MRNNRRSERHLILQTGRIRGAGQVDALECALLNVSADGACILVPSSADVPTEFTLWIDGEVGARTCTIAWKAGARVGVSFCQTKRMEL
jgi:PilZ domain